MFRHVPKFFVALVWVVISASIAASQSAQDALRLYQEGQDFHENAKSRADLEKAIKKYEQALSAWERLGDAKGEAYSLNQLGLVYDSLGQYPRALEYYEKSLKILRNIDDAQGEGQSLNNIGALYDATGQRAKALEYYEKSLEHRRKVNDVEGQAVTLNNIGMVLKSLGRHAEALECYDKSLEIKKKLGDVQGQGATLSNMGQVYDSLGQYAKAQDYFEKSIMISRHVGDALGEGVALNNIAAVYDSLGQYGKALEFYQQSLLIVKRLGHAEGEAACLDNIGKVYDSLSQYAKAIEYYKKSLEISSKVDNLQGQGTTISNIAVAYKSLGQYDKALEYLQRSLEILRNVGDVQAQAATLSNIGAVYKSWGQYGRALEYYEKSLEIQRKTGDVNGEGVTLNNIASVYESWGKYGKALDYYDNSLQIFKKLGDVKNEGTTLGNIGFVYHSLGQYSKALEHYDKSLDIRRNIGDVQGEGVTLNNVGQVFHSIGQYPKALEYLEKSLEIRRRLGDIQGEGSTLNNLGATLAAGGQYAKARDYYGKALEILRKIGDVQGEGVALSNIGRVYNSWGDYAKALNYYEKVHDILRKLGDVKGEGTTLNNIAGVYNSLGQHAKALDYYAKSVEIARKIGDVRQESVTLWNMAYVHLAMEKYDQAIAGFDKTLDIYARMGVPNDGVKNSIGEAYLEMGNIAQAEPFLKDADYDSSIGHLCLMKSDYSQARQRYRKLLKRGEENHDAKALFTAYTGLGRVFESLEDYSKAEEYYDHGVRLVEEMRSGLSPAERKEFFNVKINGFFRSEPAKGLARVRIKLNRASSGIDASETTRARGFADNLFQRSFFINSGLPQSILEEEESLLNQVAALKKALAETNRNEQAARYQALSQEVKRLELELQSFIENLRKDYPGYAASKYPRPVTLGESGLRPDEYAVVFDCSEDGVAVWLVRRREVVQGFFVQWRLKDLEKDIKAFREPFESAEPLSFDVDLAQRLYVRLFSGVLSRVPAGSPLIIIPDGVLALLPFEALVVRGTATWKKGQLETWYPEGVTYLGDMYPISYYQSLTALTLIRSVDRVRDPGSQLLVIADPVFDDRDSRATPTGETQIAKPDQERALRTMAAIKQTFGGFQFDRLPKTQELSQKLKELYGSDCDGPYTGFKADKAYFLNHIAPSIDRYGQIVLATHGLLDTRTPEIMEPFLALSLFPPGTDGFLAMSEVMGLRLNADLVALTACETGLGRQLAGEGVMSMGRAFQYAGARTVLMSLWKVEQGSSVTLVENFFRYRKKEGKSKLEALRLARDHLRSEGFAHPFFWAPFILVGEIN